jgi:dTDP-glucose pyrophosphorylase
MIPSLVILAAGIGSRYGGLKQMDPIGPSGEIIINYSIYDAIKAGFGKIIFVIKKDIEDAFKEIIGSKYEDRITVEYVYQELDDIPEGFFVPEGRKKPWGTAHALLMAEPVVQVCSCDPGGYLEDVVERIRIFKKGNAAGYKDEAGRFFPLTGDEIVSLNLWGFTPSVFGFIREQFVEFLKEWGTEQKYEFFIPNVVGRFVKEGKATLRVLESRDSWFGITYKEERENAISKIRKLIDEGVYPVKLT